MRKPSTPPEPGPVALYLSELAEGNKRTMRRSLAHACAFLGGSDPDAFPWHKVKVAQVAPRSWSEILNRFGCLCFSASGTEPSSQSHGVPVAPAMAAWKRTGTRPAVKHRRTDSGWKPVRSATCCRGGRGCSARPAPPDPKK